MIETLYTVGGVVLGTAIWLWILRSYDRIEPEAIRHLVVVGFVGGLLSITAAAFLNETVRVWIGLGPNIFEDALVLPVTKLAVFCLAVGVVEEVSKSVAAVQTTKRLGDLNEPVDAMVYAMTVALGFAAFENLFYAFRFGNEVLFARFLWPVPAHMAYAALWGYGLAWARFVHPEKPRILMMAPSVLMAAIIHAAANFLLFLQATGTAALSLAALAVLAVLAHLRLKRLVAESPFLEPGECVACRFVNEPHAAICINCGGSLETAEMFVTCRCGKSKVPARIGTCSECGPAWEPSDEEYAPTGLILPAAPEGPIRPGGGPLP